MKENRFYAHPNAKPGRPFDLSDSAEKRESKKRHHRDLPVSLQKLEAQTVIDGVASDFARKHIGETVCLISLHDCLITTEEHVDELKAMIESAFQALLGFAPPVTVARFSEDVMEAEFGETLLAAWSYLQ